MTRIVQCGGQRHAQLTDPHSSSQPLIPGGSDGHETVLVKTFGDFQFDDDRRELTSGGQPVTLSGQSLDLLCLFLERPGELVSREEIRDRLWPNTSVDVEHNLDVVVSRLRTLLQGAKRDLTYVETVPRKGYRFREPVAIIAGHPPRQHARHWTRRYLPYAVLALLASLMAILFARTRYDKFVPVQGARAVTAAGGSSHHSKR